MPKRRTPHLTEQEANDVRGLWRDRQAGWKVPALARAFNVSPAVIHAVLNMTGAYATKENVVQEGLPEPDFIISESFRLAKRAGSQYHYLAEDDDFAISAIAINAANIQHLGDKVPDWINVEVTNVRNPPFDWFSAIHDLQQKLTDSGETKLAALIETEIFQKSRIHPKKDA